MIRKDRESAHALTEKDLRAIFSAIDPHSPGNPWRESGVRERNQLIFMLLYSGLRIGEILQMRIKDIDLDREIVRVHSKTKRGIKSRTMRLPRHVVDLLHHYLCRRVLLVTDHDYAFVSYRSGMRMTAQDFCRIFMELREKVADLSVKLTASALRHAYITSLLADDVPPELIEAYFACRLRSYGRTQTKYFDMEKKK